jgi:hypothetical protein
MLIFFCFNVVNIYTKTHKSSLTYKMYMLYMLTYKVVAKTYIHAVLIMLVYRKISHFFKKIVTSQPNHAKLKYTMSSKVLK